MYGMHLGNSDDNSIQAGNWVWIKVKYPKKLTPQEIFKVKQNFKLRALDFLDNHFNKWSEDANALDFNTITTEIK